MAIPRELNSRVNNAIPIRVYLDIVQHITTVTVFTNAYLFLKGESEIMAPHAEGSGPSHTSSKDEVMGLLV